MKVYILLLRHNTIKHLIDYYTAQAFYMHRETKNFVWLTLFLYLLYHGGLDPNPKYLQ